MYIAAHPTPSHLPTPKEKMQNIVVVFASVTSTLHVLLLIPSLTPTYCVPLHFFPNSNPDKEMQKQLSFSVEKGDANEQYDDDGKIRRTGIFAY